MANAIPLLLIVEVFIEIRVVVKELLQICSAVGAGIVDCKGRCGEVAATCVTGNDDPVLTAIIVFCPKQNGFSGFEQSVERI